MRLLAIVGVVCVLAFGSCGYDDGDEPPLTQPVKPTLPSLIGDIFTRSCTFSSCHNENKHVSNLILGSAPSSDGMLHPLSQDELDRLAPIVCASLVNVPSQRFCTGRPTDSDCAGKTAMACAPDNSCPAPLSCNAGICKRVRVAPGQPALSYIINKIENHLDPEDIATPSPDGNGNMGRSMPWQINSDQPALIAPEKRTAIADWITAGAPGCTTGDAGVGDAGDGGDASTDGAPPDTNMDDATQD